MGFNFINNFNFQDSDPRPKGFFWILIILVLLILTWAVLFFGKSNDASQLSGAQELAAAKVPSPRPSRVYSVFFKNGVFSPTNLRIRMGDTVRFENNNLFSIRIVSDPHPGHSELPGLDSIGDIQPGSVFSFVFTSPGIFGYHNEKNPNEGGTIIVR